MFGLLPLFKAGERLLKSLLEAPFSLPHSSHETRSIKFGPNLDPKTLNVHQLDAGKPIQLATPTPVDLPVEDSRVQFASREEASQAGQTHMALGMAPLPE